MVNQNFSPLINARQPVKSEMPAFNNRSSRPPIIAQPVLRRNNMKEAVRQHTKSKISMGQSTPAFGPLCPLMVPTASETTAGANPMASARAGDLVVGSFISVQFSQKSHPQSLSS